MTKEFEAERKRKENLTAERNELKDKVTRLELDLRAKRNSSEESGKETG